MSPGAPTGHHEHHGGEYGTIVHRCGTATLRTWRELRNQGLDQSPQLIGHQVSGQRVGHETRSRQTVDRVHVRHALRLVAIFESLPPVCIRNM